MKGGVRGKRREGKGEVIVSGAERREGEWSRKIMKVTRLLKGGKGRKRR